MMKMIPMAAFVWHLKPQPSFFLVFGTETNCSGFNYKFGFQIKQVKNRLSAS